MHLRLASDLPHAARGAEVDVLLVGVEAEAELGVSAGGWYRDCFVVSVNKFKIKISY